MFSIYIALYRKYRPQIFSDVCGQEHITTTLKNEVVSKKVAHAYLFTGTRGTGKTTCARILAKAVNCIHPINGNPCNECEICKGINDGSIMDVIEIDAASNTGVDNIRDIRDETAYTPSVATRKVYIIDEVHMLSIGAFNALLKTLEDTPPHVMFILATTEVHKVAPTVLSRCQRFDFRRISVENMVNALDQIAKKETIKIERPAIFTIARLADGSMRDALSLLDQCASTGQVLTEEYVLSTLGLSSRQNIIKLITSCSKSDIAGGLEILSDLYNGSKSVSLLCSEMTSAFRDLMIIKTVDKPANLLSCLDTELSDLSSLCRELSLERIIYSISVLQDLQNSLQKSQNPRVDFELCLFRLCDPKLNDSYDSLLVRISDLEKKLAIGNPVVSYTADQPVKKNDQTAAPKATAAKPVKTQDSEPSLKSAGDLKKWPEILDILSSTLDKSYTSILKNAQAVIEDSHITILADSEFSLIRLSDAKVISAIESAAKSLLGTAFKAKVVSADEYNNKDVSTSDNDAFESLLLENSGLININD